MADFWVGDDVHTCLYRRECDFDESKYGVMLGYRVSDYQYSQITRREVSVSDASYLSVGRNGTSTLPHIVRLVRLVEFSP